MSNEPNTFPPYSVQTNAPDPPNSPPKKCRCGCLKNAKIFILLGIALFTFCNVNFRTLKISKETTYITGPMMSDGKRVDYFHAYEQEFYPPEMKTDENGFRLFVAAFGDLNKYEKTKYDPAAKEYKNVQLDSEPFRQQIYEKLGLDPNTPPTIDVPFKKWSGSDFIHQLAQDAENQEEKDAKNKWYLTLKENPWTLDEYPEMAEWVEISEKPLQIIADTVRKPVFYIPLTNLEEDEWTVESIIDSGLPTIQNCREFARTFQMRSKYRLGIGDIDGAIDDKISCLRLGRHLQNQGALVQWLVGIAIEGVGGAMSVENAPKYTATAAQLARLKQEMNDLPSQVSVEDCLRRERFSTLASLQAICFGNRPDFLDEPNLNVQNSFVPRENFLMRWCFDPNTVMKQSNLRYDSLLGEAKNEVAENEFMYNSVQNFLPLLTVTSRSRQMADILASFLTPVMQAAREAARRTKCLENMSKLNLALMQYEKEHGKFPENDWRVAILPYLGENLTSEEKEQIFQCPSAHLEKGETTYAVVKRENGELPVSLMLVEVVPPQKLSEGDGTIAAELVKLGMRDGDNRRQNGIGSNHAGGCNTASRDGSILFWAATADSKILAEMIEGKTDDMNETPKTPSIQ
ncbi:MAG: DUF1559 domain-containing protein [Thermoguttaceae bacterium]